MYCDPRFAREVPDRDSIDNKLCNSQKKDGQIYKKIIGRISNRMHYFAISIIRAESIKMKIKHFDEIGGSGQAHFGPSGPEAFLFSTLPNKLKINDAQFLFVFVRIVFGMSQSRSKHCQ